MVTSIFDLAREPLLDIAARLIESASGIPFSLSRPLLDYLLRYGYSSKGKMALALVNPEVMVEEFRHSIAQLEIFHGIEPTGQPHDALLNVLTVPRCGCVDVQQLGTEAVTARWNKPEIRWFVRNYLDGLQANQQEQIFAAAFDSWRPHGGLKHTRVTQERDADIVFFCSRIDGSGRVLAQAQLPPGNDQPIWLQIDTGEVWKVGGTPSGLEILLLNVVSHELGHNFGLDHTQTRGQLMLPVYSPAVASPQQEDAARYGRLYPGSQPPPPAVPGKKRYLLESASEITLTPAA